ncbi:MAG: NADPH-dependent FMN reductase, partial [Mesorhizobium sp.]
YIGYWKPYATSHDELDADHAVQTEVRNAALALAEAVEKRRAGSFQTIGAVLEDPRPK